ncbi:hypothetical protein Y1Q_0004017 [Alligator mississippiensis]|uniref:Uncharacterized protein n=1 Tax=Alligator mississippiensis TaxID=8496 RepID=A0A151PHU5_ALLMI|nr:hypothetical protein Y1Q_0004017 [Alligator mississippiensis]
MESLVARLEGCGDSNLHFEEVELVKRVESCSRPEKVELIYTVTESEGFINDLEDFPSKQFNLALSALQRDSSSSQYSY